MVFGVTHVNLVFAQVFPQGQTSDLTLPLLPSLMVGNNNDLYMMSLILLEKRDNIIFKAEVWQLNKRFLSPDSFLLDITSERL